MSEPNTQAAIGILAKALFGITYSAAPPPDPDTPELSVSEMVADGDTVYAKVHLPSGDVYRLTVEWDRDESP